MRDGGADAPVADSGLDAALDAGGDTGRDAGVDVTLDGGDDAECVVAEPAELVTSSALVGPSPTDWAHSLTGPGAESIRGLAVDDAGGVYFAADVQADARLDGVPLALASNAIFVASVSPDGALRWSRTLPTTVSTRVAGAELLGTGASLVVAGSFAGTLSVPGHGDVIASGERDLFLFWLDPATGEVLDAVTFGGNATELADALTTLADDTIVVVGHAFVGSTVPRPTVDVGFGPEDAAAEVSELQFVATYSPAGTPVFRTTFGGTGSPGSVRASATGDTALVTGNFVGRIALGGIEIESIVSGRTLCGEPFLLEIDGAGSLRRLVRATAGTRGCRATARDFFERGDGSRAWLMSLDEGADFGAGPLHPCFAGQDALVALAPTGVVSDVTPLGPTITGFGRPHAPLDPTSDGTLISRSVVDGPPSGWGDRQLGEATWLGAGLSGASVARLGDDHGERALVYWGGVHGEPSLGRPRVDYVTRIRGGSGGRVWIAAATAGGAIDLGTGPLPNVPSDQVDAHLFTTVLP